MGMQNTHIHITPQALCSRNAPKSQRFGYKCFNRHQLFMGL